MKYFFPIIISFLLAQDSFSMSIACDQCHSPGRWLPLNKSMLFNHQLTSFPLLGQHVGTDCIQCHNGLTVEERHNFSQANQECQTCHLDIHYGDFGFSCTDCHTTNDWTHNQMWPGHNFTHFPLLGVHRSIPCNDCHSNSPELLIGSDCIQCHTMDYTNALASGNHPEDPSCERCHNSNDFSSIEVGKHDILFFPINSGSHKGEWSTCTAECHISPSDYTVLSCGLNGVCHDHNQDEMDEEHDDENGYIYESNSCLSCHPNGEEHD